VLRELDIAKLVIPIDWSAPSRRDVIVGSRSGWRGSASRPVAGVAPS
jgi:hypothetical protein